MGHRTLGKIVYVPTRSRLWGRFRRVLAEFFDFNCWPITALGSKTRCTHTNNSLRFSFLFSSYLSAALELIKRLLIVKSFANIHGLSGGAGMETANVLVESSMESPLHYRRNVTFRRRIYVCVKKACAFRSQWMEEIDASFSFTFPTAGARTNVYFSQRQRKGKSPRRYVYLQRCRCAVHGISLRFALCRLVALIRANTRLCRKREARAVVLFFIYRAFLFFFFCARGRKKMQDFIANYSCFSVGRNTTSCCNVFPFRKLAY